MLVLSIALWVAITGKSPCLDLAPSPEVGASQEESSAASENARYTVLYCQTMRGPWARGDEMGHLFEPVPVFPARPQKMALEFEKIRIGAGRDSCKMADGTSSSSKRRVE
jgi:hypothetical protein